MNLTDTRRYEMLVRVRDFGGAHPDIFPPESLGGKTFAAVGAAVGALGQQAAAQVSSRGGTGEGKRAKTSARTRLVTALQAIRRTARAVAIDSPGVDGKFRVPFSNSQQGLLAAARSCAQEAHAISTSLIEHGLPPTFLDDLDGAIRAFESAIRDVADGVAGDMAARAGLGAAMEAGLTAVVRLDAIVPNRLRDDVATLALWRRAREVDHPGRARNGRKSEVRSSPQPPTTAEQPQT